MITPEFLQDAAWIGSKAKPRVEGAAIEALGVVLAAKSNFSCSEEYTKVHDFLFSRVRRLMHRCLVNMFRV